MKCQQEGKNLCVHEHTHTRTCTKALPRMPTHTHMPDPMLRIDWFSNYDYSNQQTLRTSFQMKHFFSLQMILSVTKWPMPPLSQFWTVCSTADLHIRYWLQLWVTSYIHDAVCAQQCRTGHQGPRLWLLWKMGISNLEASVLSNFIRRRQTVWRNTRTGWTALLWDLLQV